MDEQLDNDLQKRIREVFDNYEDRTADQGWQLLREKFPENKKKGAAVWFWYGAAAILLLFFGIGLWKYYEKAAPLTYVNYSGKQPKIYSRGNQARNKVSLAGQYQTTSAANKDNRPKAEQKTLPIAVSLLNTTVKYKETTNTDTSAVAAENGEDGNIILAAKTNDTTKTALINGKTQMPGAAANPFGPAIRENTKQTPKSINSMLAEKQPQQGKKLSDRTKNVLFAVYAGTFFNYAKGSKNNVNLGAGFTADIKIGRNLKLVTGLAVAQNSLDYNGGIPASSQNSFETATVKLLPSVANFSNNFQPATTVQNYNASLVGLDIPLNLMYDFSHQKNDLYVSAGLSSGTFINEAYTYQYNYPASSAPFLQQTQGLKTDKSFSSFYIAKTLNLAFGTGLPFGKNTIIIEPFFKYPIGGMGSQDLRFGSGGVNLKFNFQKTK